MTLEVKLPKPMLIHRRQPKSLSVILYCNLVQFLSPVFEGAQHQSQAMILICGVRTNVDDSLLQPGSVSLVSSRVH